MRCQCRVALSIIYLHHAVMLLCFLSTKKRNSFVYRLCWKDFVTPFRKQDPQNTKVFEGADLPDIVVKYEFRHDNCLQKTAELHEGIHNAKTLCNIFSGCALKKLLRECGIQRRLGESDKKKNKEALNELLDVFDSIRHGKFAIPSLRTRQTEIRTMLQRKTDRFLSLLKQRFQLRAEIEKMINGSSVPTLPPMLATCFMCFNQFDDLTQNASNAQTRTISVTTLPNGDISVQQGSLTPVDVEGYAKKAWKVFEATQKIMLKHSDKNALFKKHWTKMFEHTNEKSGDPLLSLFAGYDTGSQHGVTNPEHCFFMHDAHECYKELQSVCGISTETVSNVLQTSDITKALCCFYFSRCWLLKLTWLAEYHSECTFVPDFLNEFLKDSQTNRLQGIWLPP